MSVISTILATLLCDIGASLPRQLQQNISSAIWLGSTVRDVVALRRLAVLVVLRASTTSCSSKIVSSSYPPRAL